MPSLETGIESANAIASLIEKILDRVLSISDNRKRKAEIGRLHVLLNQVRIGRTLNAGLAEYVRQTVSRTNWPSADDPSVMIDQIEASLTALVSIINEMAEEKDRIILHDNESFQQLSLVARGRHNLLKELRELAEMNNGEKLRTVMAKYENLADELGMLSFKLADAGRKIDID